MYTGLDGVAKALRRGFDKLNDPKIVAIGMIDAWRGYDKWQLGASLILACVEQSALYDALPGGGLWIEAVTGCFRKMMRVLIARSRIQN